MLSPDGLNKTFDCSANGYVRGEGGGCVVVRRLREAERDARRGVGGEILGEFGLLFVCLLCFMFYDCFWHLSRF